MLRLHNVSKRYGGTVAVAPVDLKLEAARTYVLVGPSGCGKSTLLKLMLGLVDTDSGEVSIGDEMLTDANMLEMRRRVGYVIQEGGLFPHLTAEDNVALLSRFIGWQPRTISTRLAELAELTHLPLETLRRYPAQLSGGQRQRVSLMRALMLDPEVLLLDEPLGALDPMIRRELQEDLREVFRSLNKTVVMVTHDVSEAAFFADEVILLRDGTILQRGSMSDMMRRPANPFVSDFINAQRTELPGDA